MMPRRQCFALSLLTCLLTAACSGGATKEGRAAPLRPVVGRALVAALAADAAEHPVRVIIAFRESAADAKAQPAARQAAISKLQQALIARQIPGLAVTHRYDHVAAVAGTVSREALDQLESDPSIASIDLDEMGGGH